ncbi:hypothetical protein C1703_18815 [Streptomyces sp. Go-475]|nr:hypothetical protein C1703_18815 [Streptomyces sp. Go-475]
MPEPRPPAPEPAPSPGPARPGPPYAEWADLTAGGMNDVRRPGNDLP